MGKNVGVVLAGGKGERFGTVPPKQFVFIGEKMIIEYTIENLESSKNIDEIYITINPAYTKLGEELAKKYEKITKIIEGGRTRTESIYNSMLHLDSEVKKIVFIDAVRPFVPPYVFEDFIKLLDKYDIVKFCSKIVDYLAFTGGSSFIKEIHDRDKWRLCKAPVGYKGELARLISKIPREEVLNFESDLELVLSRFPNSTIYSYESTEFNFKITYKEDLHLAKILLKYPPRSI